MIQEKTLKMDFSTIMHALLYNSDKMYVFISGSPKLTDLKLKFDAFLAVEKDYGYFRHKKMLRNFHYNLAQDLLVYYKNGHLSKKFIAFIVSCKKLPKTVDSLFFL